METTFFLVVGRAVKRSLTNRLGERRLNSICKFHSISLITTQICLPGGEECCTSPILAGDYGAGQSRAFDTPEKLGECWGFGDSDIPVFSYGEHCSVHMLQLVSVSNN